MSSRCTDKFLNGGYSEFLLWQLNEFRKNEQFTDVVLVCGDIRIPAHRNILAASSNYFAAMFGGHFPESNQPEISLRELDANCVQCLIDFIYTGRLRVEEDFVEQLLATASFLQLGHAEDLCTEYMVHHLSPKKQNNVLLLQAAKDFTIMHFQEVVNGEEFLEMTNTEISFTVRHNIVQLYNVLFIKLAAILQNLYSADTVLLNLVRWAEHKPDERIQHLNLVEQLHPACVTPEVADSLSILKKEPRSCSWLDDVKQCISNADWRIFTLDKGEGSEMQSSDMNFEIVTPLKPLPSPAYGFSLSGYRNILYVQGGGLGERSLATSYYYSIYRDQWYDLKQLELGRYNHRSVILQDKLYTLGGETDQGYTATVEWLNLATNKSCMSGNMSVERCSMGAVASNQAIYVMGGQTDLSTLYSAESYDPRVGSWMELPSMSVVNSFCSSALIGESIYCCDGVGSCMERFDLRANKWQVIDLKESQCDEIFAVDSKLFGVSEKEISRFDIDNFKWITEYKFPEERKLITAAIGLMMVNYNVPEGNNKWAFPL